VAAVVDMAAAAVTAADVIAGKYLVK